MRSLGVWESEILIVGSLGVWGSEILIVGSLGVLGSETLIMGSLVFWKCKTPRNLEI